MKKRDHKMMSIINTKKAAASIYVVLFTTVLLSVITLSFIRIVLSENFQTTNTDLSQSAYDSALAGTEDAKIALLKYHDCLSRGFTANRSKVNENERDVCENIIRDMEDFIASDSCDTVSKVLGRLVQNNSGSVIIDTVTSLNDKNTGGDGVSKTLSQSYTCVKIKQNIKDYVSTLDYDNRSRVIPLRVKNIDEIKSISLSWHSINRNNAHNSNLRGLKFQEKGVLENGTRRLGEPFNPPALKLEYTQTDAQKDANGDLKDMFALGHFYSSRGAENTDRGFMFLKPTDQQVSNESTHNINKTENSFASSNDNAYNNFVEVFCDPNGRNIGGGENGTENNYMCNAVIKLPRPFLDKKRSQNSTFLRVSLPYADMSTEFSLKLCTEENGTNCESDFGAVQAVIDATGRATDFYRRIESRVELADTNFPYPENAISTPSGDFNKNFRTTNNCWTERGTCADYKSPAE